MSTDTIDNDRTVIIGPFDRPGHLRGAGPSPDSIVETPAVALAADLRSRAIRSVEVVTAFLDRIETMNPVHNAIISMRARTAILADAQAADDALARGESVGPLHGLPIAIKDLAPTRGHTTTFGSPIYRDHVPEIEGIAAGRMRAAGGILIGKTNTPEFGLGSHTFNPVFGATGNAFNSSRSAGGSSGGAAVSLATRMLPLADGSDMGGSLRNPAAFNNVIGLRPSFGRVPSLPAGNIFEASLSTDGPMARSADDLEFLLSVQAGADPRQPLSANLPPVDRVRDRGIENARIGWLADFGGHLATEPGILDMCERALSVFESAGMVVERADLGFPSETIWQSFVVMRHAALAGRYGRLVEDTATRDLVKPEMQWEVEKGRAVTASELYVAGETRTAWYQRLLKLFDMFDFITLPAAQVWPFPVDWRWPKDIAGRSMDTYHRWMECIAPGTLSGCPVLALPAGFRNNLSTGIQIIAPPGREADLIALARVYERQGFESWQ